MGILGPQRLAFPARVVRHHAAGGVQDVLGGAIVLFQLDDAAPRVVPLEVQDVVEVGPPPTINRLIVVSHDAQIAVPATQEVDDLILRLVRILVLVHQNIPPEVLVVLQSVRVVAEEQDRQHQEVVEVHRVAGPESILIQAVDLRRSLFREIRRERGVFARCLHLVLGAADPGRHRPGVQDTLALRSAPSGSP